MIHNSVMQSIPTQSMRMSTVILMAILASCADSWCLKTEFSAIDEIKSIDFSKNGKFVLTAEKSGRVTLWKFNTLEPVREYNFGNIVEEAVISKDMKQVAIGGDNDNVIVLDFNSFAVMEILATGHGYVYDLDYRYDNKDLLTCGRDKNIRTWNTSSFVNLITEQMRHEVLSCEYSIGHFILASGRRVVEVWRNNFDDGTLSFNFQQIAEMRGDGDNRFWGLRARHDKKDNSHLIAVSDNGTVLEMKFDGTEMGTWTTAVASLLATDYATDDSYLALTGSSSRVLMYNTTDRANSLETALQTQSATDLVSAKFSYDSNYFATGNRNGTVYLFSRFCTGCPVGSYKKKTVCRPCYLDSRGCAICTNASTCTACHNGYYLRGSSCRFCDHMEGCAQCNTSSLCTSCLPGFFKDGPHCGRCYSSMRGCLQCDTSAVCLHCDNKHVLVGSECQTCPDVLQNCQYCNSSIFCEECVVGFYEQAGACLPCPDKCIACQDAVNCTLCTVKYYMGPGGGCVPCQSSQCLTCNNLGQCLECQEDHFSNSTFDCTPCLHPCDACNSSIYCMGCVQGFYLSAAGLCSHCPTGCYTCNTTTYCSSCDTGYHLDTAAHTCIQCHQVDPLCHSCNSTHCLDCEPGALLLPNGSCSACLTQIPNCMICSNNSICEHCLIAYFETGLSGIDSCKVCEPGCRRCDNSTQCWACEPGYYPDAGDCHFCQLPCYSCSSPTTCLTCLEGQYLSNSTCLACKSTIKGCQSCLTGPLCLICENGFTLTPALPNVCSPCSHPCTTCKNTVTTCLTCALGYYLSANACLHCDEKCRECGAAANQCTLCGVGFYLFGTDCVPCSIADCLACSAVGNCVQCRSGFLRQTNGTCLSCLSPLSHCLKCSSDGPLCSLCQYGFTLASGSTVCDSCLLLIDNCEHCVNPTTCHTCVQGFFPNSTHACEMCPSGCYLCSDAGSCQICIESYVEVSGVCHLCEDSLMGCDTCASLSVCLSCLRGFYLESGACVPCSDSLVGCIACDSSASCSQCSVFYELDTVAHGCVICSALYDGCQVCAQGLCVECSMGLFLDAGACLPCELPIAGCLHCDSNSLCTSCASGYRLLATSCQECDAAYPHCIYCSGTACEQCESGYYLTAGSCSPCTNPGCEICLPDQPSQCLSCNTMYYLTGDRCQLCSSQLNQCLTCSSPLLCSECSHGFYLNPSFRCQLCSDLYKGCSTCTASTCLDCLANFFLETGGSSHVCIPCTHYLVGCSYCSSSSVCLSCQNGYYVIANTCERCSRLQNCLYCEDGATCTYCQDSFYLNITSSSCSACSSQIPGCFSCSDPTTCISCQGHLQLISGQCEQIKGEVQYKYPQLTLQSYYITNHTLHHILSSKHDKFQQIEQDWAQESQLWLIGDDYAVIPLTVENVSWSEDAYHMLFVTDNPIAAVLGDSVQDMPFMREPQTDGEQRLLMGSSLPLDFQFKLMLSEQATHSVLPSLDHIGDLNLNYPLNSPQFYRSYMKQQNTYHYFIFGLTVTVMLFLIFSIKSLCLLPASKNRGQIIGHIFAIKCGGLALYPTYAEFVDYCYGFMMADFPCLNSRIGEALGARHDDVLPPPHAMYYINLSLASTYLLAIVALALMWLFVAVYGYLRPAASAVTRMRATAFKGFLYNFFCLGATLAGFLCLEGALLNPISSLSIGSATYIAGIILYVGIFVQMVHSMARKKIADPLSQMGKEKVEELQQGMHDNFYKLRMFCKATLLGMLHLNPLYFFITLFGFELSAILIDYFLRKDEKSHPKLEILQHVVINIALGMILSVPDAVLGLFLVSALILIVIAIELYLMWEEIKMHQTVHGRAEAEQKEKDINPFNYTYSSDKNHTEAGISLSEAGKEEEQEDNQEKGKMKKKYQLRTIVFEDMEEVVIDVQDQQRVKKERRKEGRKEGKKEGDQTFVIEEMEEEEQEK